MKNYNGFIRLCEKNYSDEDLRLIKKSIKFIELHLKGEKKFSDKSILEFNIDIGEILVKSRLSVDAVVSGILYGIEKTVEIDEIVKNFGDEIAKIISGQSKFRTIKKNNPSARAELMRKMLIIGLDDIRIIFVKLAVKLANLRIISGLERAAQKRIADDILTLYVPLASRLGLDYIKNDLEDLAFKTIHPKQYREISNFFKKSKEERENFIKKFIGELENLLGSKLDFVKIKGRNKQIRSIFNKIVKKSVALKKQRDHYAIRIIVKTEADCYKTLGILHEKYIPMPNRLKDYINSPKPNGYQSIHTVLKIPNSGEEIEVQIRTEAMDDFAEEGRAAHWSYKKTGGDPDFERKVGWLKALIKSQSGSSDEEFVKNLRFDLFADKIYCYTPKGDIKELPKNSTLLDFAYYVHQEIGEKTVGGRINGKFAPLKKTLKNGDIIEILTNKNQRPRRDWLKFVVSSKAKSKIKQGLRKYESTPVPNMQTIKVDKMNDYDSLVESPELPSAKFSFAKCCYPLPKDELLGIMKSNRRFLVHKYNCPRIMGKRKNVIPIFWKESFNRPLNLTVLCEDRSGILADLLNTISRMGFTVKNASAKIVGNSDVKCNFAIIPREIDEVYKMIKGVEKVRSVIRVFFE